MEAIRTRNLTKVYKGFGKKKGPALDRVNLTIPEGEVFGFLGRNGAGKTTTIKILCSLLKPGAGEAFVFGENVRTRHARRLIGYLPEQPYYYEYLTPKETLDFYGQLDGLSAAERAKEWDKLSEMLDLRGMAGTRIKEFSKGMRQRIGFAVALVGDPPLLILDEPMSGLDPLGRRMIRELILAQRDQRKTVFFSSHVLGDVEQICDRVGILVKGKLARQGRLDELTGTQAHEVEIVVTGLKPQALEELRARAIRHRTVEELAFFTLPDTAAANAAVERIHATGATLVDFSPLKKSLEDYFLREQEHEETPA